MRKLLLLIACGTTAISASPATANTSDGFRGGDVVRSSAELPPYLQCVPYARQQSGIQIYGDAHTWWDKAKGRFARGNQPKVGAVMAFQPHRNMRLGHVAAVSRIIDNRTVLLRHSNWSPINGRRGQIENDVRAIDVSPNNDWTQVRVWYHPIQGLGKTAWPIHGFIYSDKAPNFSQQSVQIARVPERRTPVSRKPSRRFASAFADLNVTPAPAPALRRSAPFRTPQRDAIANAISKYD